MGFGAEVFKIYGYIALNNVDNVYKDLDKINRKGAHLAKDLAKLGKAVNQLGLTLSRGLSVPLAGISTALGALGLKTGEYADKILSMQEATGLSNDTLQEFQHVATAVGGSSDALFSTITKLTGKLPDIAAGTGKTAEAFRELGLNVLNADGSYRSMDAVFPEIIKGLQSVTDQTQRNVLAYEIFGGASKEVANFVGMSADEMGKLRKEAHDLGLVMGDAALKRADTFRVGVENRRNKNTGEYSFEEDLNPMGVEMRGLAIARNAGRLAKAWAKITGPIRIITKTNTTLSHRTEDPAKREQPRRKPAAVIVLHG